MLHACCLHGKAYKPLPATMVLQNFCLYGFSLCENACVAPPVNDGHVLPCKKDNERDVLH